MSNKVTWKSFKEYGRESWAIQVELWKDWGWQEWAAQTGWLVILVAILYYGVHGVVGTLRYASDSGVDPNGPIGILLTFVIFVPVIAIFVGNWLYSKFVHFLFTKFAK
jgi:hypothetical protein